jgi:Rps23 Pro-64 3,4-dihydroxylase Tpa1-like proline 4-hydroxylase
MKSIRSSECLNAVDKHLILSRVESFSLPFKYFTSLTALENNLAMKTLNWLESGAPWTLVETDFYEQYEFSLCNAALPAEIQILVSPAFVDALRIQVGGIFETELGSKVDVTAHKLVKDQRIRIHNDFISGHETHRLLIQLNREWKPQYGGLLILFNSSDPANIHRILLPLNNSALGFAVSAKSNHAVTVVQTSERFTLVYSFYNPKGNEQFTGTNQGFLY